MKDRNNPEKAREQPATPAKRRGTAPVSKDIESPYKLWSGQLKNTPDVLTLPIDRERLAIQSSLDRHT